MDECRDKRRMHIATADFRHPHKTVKAPRNIMSSDTGLGADGNGFSWEAAG